MKIYIGFLNMKKLGQHKDDLQKRKESTYYQKQGTDFLTNYIVQTPKTQVKR